MIGLVQIAVDGTPAEKITLENTPARQYCIDTAAHYARAGFHPPWCGYLAVNDDVPVGVCGFRGPPDAGECVEIAYQIFPGHEGQGVGSAMVEALVGIARDHNPQMAVRTTTALDDEASSQLLPRLGFRDQGECDDQYLGRGRCWKLLAGDDTLLV